MPVRLGLCCTFNEQPIKFRQTTATAAGKLTKQARDIKLSDLCRTNAQSLREAIQYCSDNGIGCFRINSKVLPLKTHGELGYHLGDLPDGSEIQQMFVDCGKLAADNNVRLAFHPDQFVVLSSPKPEVVDKSIDEIEYQCEVADWIGADVVNIHGGGGYGDKDSALKRFAHSFNRLSDNAKSKLTVENDDKVYSPQLLLPLCEQLGIPLVYDVHHHRCYTDGWTIEQATEYATATWNREPLFHISSPILGWDGKQPNRHHDYIDWNDFPEHWLNLNITVEVEAKAKEKAVLQLKEQLEAKLSQN